MNRLSIIVQDTETYKKVESKKNKIENQANRLIKNVCKGLPRGQMQKLLSTGSRPAQFQAFVKDHKNKTDEFFPLRPIASVKNTPVEKVDWLLSEVLTQLVEFVPANIKNSSEVRSGLEKLDPNVLSGEKTFFSLDVINALYPSIKIDFGISRQSLNLLNYTGTILTTGA